MKTKPVPDPFALPSVIPPAKHKHSERCQGADDMLALVPGLTYRQLDYWTTKGYIPLITGKTHPGHGIYRCWDVSQAEVLRRALRFIRVGFQPQPAIELARLEAADEVITVLETAVA